jgi:ribonuclease HI
MKQLKFEKKYAEEIIAGNKHSTFRVNDDKAIRPGDRVEMVVKTEHDRPQTWEVPGYLIVDETIKSPLGSLGDSDFASAESFSSKDEMIDTFRRFYGEHINESTIIRIIKFSYEPYESSKPYLEMKNGEDEVRNIPAAKLYADGGSRGNPGPSASGYVVLNQNDDVLHQGNKYLGVTTNNQAEYHGVLDGMQWCLKHGVKELDVYLDSLLVVNQMKGIFKVKNRDLWSLYERVKETAGKFNRITFTHVPRELNKLADAEVNKALDAVKGSDVVQ